MAGAVTVGALVVKLSADAGTFKTDMQSATSTAQASAQTIVNAWAGVTAATDGSTAAGKRMVEALKSEISTFGMTSEELNRHKAVLAGVGTEYSALQARLSSMKDSQSAFNSEVKSATQGFSAHSDEVKKATGHMEGFSFGTSVAKRELLVLTHELSQGNFKRFGGSLLVLGEQTGAASLLFSAAGLSIIGLGVAALGVGALMVKGALEQKAFTEAVILTGGAAGVTADGLMLMAHAAVATSGSVGVAKEAVLALASSGKFTAAEILKIGEAATSMHTATGAAIDETVKQFEELAKKPAEASAKLNEQYHYLTQSVFEQILALEKQGHAVEATKLAEDQYADAIKQRAGEIESNLGNIAGWWRNITRAVGGAKDAVMEWGKASTAGSNLEGLQKQLSDMDWKKSGSAAQDAADRVSLLGQIAAAQDQVNRAALRASEQGITQQVRAAAIHATSVLEAEDSSRKRQSALEVALAKDKEFEASVRVSDQVDGTHSKLITEDAIRQREIDTRKAHTAAIKKESQAGLDDRAQILADQLTLEQTAQDREKTIFDDREKMLALYHSKFATSDKDFYDGRETARKEYAVSLVAAYERESNLVANFDNKNPAEEALSQTHLDKLYRQVVENLDKLAKARGEDQVNILADQAKKIQVEQDASDKTVEKINEEILAVQTKIDAYGKVPSAISAVTIARLEDQAATLRTLQLDALESEGMARKLANIDAEIVARKGLRDAQVGNEAVEAATAAASKAEAAWDASSKKIGDGLYAALSNGGESAIKKLIKDMKEWFARLVLSPIVSPIAAAGASLLNPSAASAAGSAGNAFSGISNAASATSGFFSAGASLAGNSGAAIASGATYASGFASQQSLMLAAQETFGATSTALTGASSAMGALTGTLGAIPVWGWAALAAVAAFSLLGKGGETRYGGGYNTTPGSQINLAGGPDGGEITAPQTRAMIQASADGLQKALKDFGSTAIVSAFTAGGESSKLGRANVFAGGSVNGVGFGMGGGDNDPKVKLGNADPTQVTAALTLQLKRATLEGLQAANIGGVVSKYLASLGDLAGLTDGAADAALKQIGEIQSLTIAMKTLPFPQLRDASLEAVMAISSVVGGIAALGAKLGSYYSNYYTQEEQSAAVLKRVSSALADVNIALPDTRDQFRALVDAQDLTTTSGQTAYAALLNVADAFASVVPVATAAAAATNSTAKATADATYKTQRSLDIQLLQAQGNAEAALNAQRADTLSLLVGEQKVRQQQIYDAQDAATAQTAYNTALANVTAATQAVTSATQGVAAAYQTLVSDLQTAQNKVASISQQIAQSYTTAVTAEQAASAQTQAARQAITSGYVAAQTTVNNLRQQEADGLRKLATTIRDFLGTMATTSIAGASASAQRAALNGQLATNSALAQGGDQVAGGKLTGIASSLLTLSKDNSETAVDFAREAGKIANTLALTADAIDAKATTTAKSAADPMAAAMDQLALWTAAVTASGASFSSANTNLLAGYAAAVEVEKKASAQVAYWSMAVNKTGADVSRAATNLVDDFQTASAQAAEAQKALDEANALRGTIDLSISSSLQKFVEAMKTLNTSIASLAAAQGVATTAGAAAGVVASATPTAASTTGASTTAAASAPALGGSGSAAALAAIAATPKRKTFSNDVFLDNYDAKLESATSLASALKISVAESFLLSGGHSQAFWQEVHKDTLAGGSPTEASITAKGFAMGGDHRGGFRIVGENGPELEATGPSRIFNAAQTKDMLTGKGGSELVAALLPALIAIVQSSKESTKIFRRWEGDGLPATRTLA